MQSVRKIFARAASEEDGFTLLEMILSIGIIALTSGFILQMFLVSETVNKRALDADMGLNAAIGAIEAVKGLPSFDDIVSLPDYEVAVDGNKARVFGAYDSDWQPAGDVLGLDASEYPQEVRFVLEMEVKNNPNVGIDAYISFSTAGDYIEGYGTGKLSEIECQVYELRRDGEAEPAKAELARFSSCKYFSN
jgi:prepilin-type N-terminal cleavage/methylation domain-containing protein